MGYILPSSSADDILLMIAYEQLRGGDMSLWPKPYDEGDPDYDYEKNGLYGTTKGQPAGVPSFIYLNATEVMFELHRQHYFYDHPRTYHGICLTWKGWARVKELLDMGKCWMTEEERAAYASDTNHYSQTGQDPREYRERMEKGEKLPWRCRWFGHVPVVQTADIGSYSAGWCERCEIPMWRRALYSGRLTGPWYRGKPYNEQEPLKVKGQQ